MIYEKFGHKFEFRTTGDTAPPDSPADTIAGAAFTDWYKFDDGSWESYHGFQGLDEKFLDECDNLLQIFELLYWKSDPKLDKIKSDYRSGIIKEILDSDI